MSDRVAIAGVFVDDLTDKEALGKIGSFIDGGGTHQVLTANPLMIMAAEKDAVLRAAFQSAALVVADSVGVQWAARWQGRRLTKISGIDLMEKLCANAGQKGWRIFLMGGAPGVAEGTAQILTHRYAGLVVAGTHHGYFQNDSEVVSLIARAKPDLLFVALSTPFQDGWIHKNLDRLNAKVVMGVGGSFDVISGRLRRAPAWMRRIGFEWFYRLIQEPRRWTRMLRLPLFPIKCLTICSPVKTESSPLVRK